MKNESNIMGLLFIRRSVKKIKSFKIAERRLYKYFLRYYISKSFVLPQELFEDDSKNLIRKYRIPQSSLFP